MCDEIILRRKVSFQIPHNRRICLPLKDMCLHKLQVCIVHHCQRQIYIAKRFELITLSKYQARYRVFILSLGVESRASIIGRICRAYCSCNPPSSVFRWKIVGRKYPTVVVSNLLRSVSKSRKEKIWYLSFNRIGHW